jgi:hypothetical protein
MLLRSSILAGVAVLALAGFAQAAGQTAPSDMPSSQAPTAAAPAMPATGMSLNDVQSPKTTLKGAKVQDSKGEAVGEVKSVQLGADGKVAAVNVEVGGKTVALKAETLTYAQADNTLHSTQTKAEIAQ